MSHTKEIITAISTLAVAVGIGFVMQSSDAARERYGSSSTDVAPVSNDPAESGKATTIGLNVSEDAFLDVQSIELTAAIEDTTLPEIELAPEIIPVAAPVGAMPDELPAEMEVEGDCEVVASAAARPAAMIALHMEAPCLANERLTVHHHGMMFSAITDAEGKLDLTVPAMAETSVFILAFANGDGAVVQAEVPDIDQFHRTVLQWRGDAGFELHAREFGAEYGARGHVWTGTGQNIGGIVRGENGFAMRLGDLTLQDPLVAEVYTYPAGQSAQSGTIDLSVEAEVTLRNCGREVEAQTLERDLNGVIRTRDLILSVPDCSATGSFLVLNNLLSDLKIASK